MLAPPIESLTVGRGVPVNSRLTFGCRDTLYLNTQNLKNVMSAFSDYWLYLPCIHTVRLRSNIVIYRAQIIYAYR